MKTSFIAAFCNGKVFDKKWKWGACTCYSAFWRDRCRSDWLANQSLVKLSCIHYVEKTLYFFAENFSKKCCTNIFWFGSVKFNWIHVFSWAEQHKLNLLSGLEFGFEIPILQETTHIESQQKLSDVMECQIYWQHQLQAFFEFSLSCRLS